MACTITKGQKRNGCRVIGGINSVYFILKGEATYLPTLDVSGKLTSIGSGAANELQMYQFENLHGIGSAIETIVPNQENNTVHFEQTLTVNARELTADSLTLFNELAVASVAAIVHYESGISRLFGQEFFLDSSGGENSSGEAAADGNPFSVVFSGMEIDKAPLVDGAVSGTPLGNIAATEYTIVTG